MGELFAPRQGRSAWGTALPLGQFALQNLPFQTRSSLLNFSQLSRASPSRTPARLLARQPRSEFPSLAARPLPDSTLSGVRVVFERRGNAANTAANLPYEDVLSLEARSAKKS